MVNRRKDNRPTGPGNRTVTSDLERRIAAARGERAAESAGGRSSGYGGNGLGRAARLGTEFVAAVLVGTGLGYGLDLWLHTQPWLMLVMLLVGFAAGILNVVRAAADMNAANPAPAGADLGPDADNEDEQD